MQYADDLPASRIDTPEGFKENQTLKQAARNADKNFRNYKVAMFTRNDGWCSCFSGAERKLISNYSDMWSQMIMMEEKNWLRDNVSIWQKVKEEMSPYHNFEHILICSSVVEAEFKDLKSILDELDIDILLFMKHYKSAGCCGSLEKQLTRILQLYHRIWHRAVALQIGDYLVEKEIESLQSMRSSKVKYPCDLDDHSKEMCMKHVKVILEVSKSVRNDRQNRIPRRIQGPAGDMDMPEPMVGLPEEQFNIYDGLNKFEFMKAMGILKVSVTKKEIEQLYNRHCKTLTRSLTAHEFIAVLHFELHAEAVAVGDPLEVLERYREQLEKYFVPGIGAVRKFEAVFSEVDEYKNGYIDKIEFAQALEDLWINPTQEDVDTLYEAFAPDEKITWDYAHFIKLLRFDKPIAHKPKAAVSELDTVLDKVRRGIVTYLGQHFVHSPPIIKQLYAEMDSDNNGSIDKLEFQKAISVFINISPSDVDLLYEKYDSNCSNTLDYNEFLTLLGTGTGHTVSAQKQADCDSLTEMIRKKLEQHLGRHFASSATTLTQVFQEMDQGGNQGIDKSELQKGLGVMHVHLNKTEIDMIFTKYDLGKINTLDVNQFIKMVQLNEAAVAVGTGVKKNGSGAEDDKAPSTTTTTTLVDRYTIDYSGGLGVSKQVEQDCCELAAKVKKEIVFNLGVKNCKKMEKLEEFFKEMSNGGEVVDKVRFGQATKLLRLDFTPVDIDLLYSKFNTDRTGLLKFSDFMTMLNFKPGVSPDEVFDCASVLEKIRKELEAKYGNKWINNIRTPFVELDTTKSGYVDNKQFQKAMNKLSVVLTTNEVGLVYEKYDTKNECKLNYVQFFALLKPKPPLDPSADPVADKLRKQLLEVHITSVKAKLLIKEVWSDLEQERNKNLPDDLVKPAAAAAAAATIAIQDNGSPTTVADKGLETSTEGTGRMKNSRGALVGGGGADDAAGTSATLPGVAASLDSATWKANNSPNPNRKSRFYKRRSGPSYMLSATTDDI